MSAPAAPPKIDKADKSDFPSTGDPLPKALPAEQFWQKYSPHYEFPLSNVASIAVHVLVLVGIIFLIKKMTSRDGEVPAVPVHSQKIKLGDGSRGHLAGGPGDGTAENKEVDDNDRQPDPQREIPQAELSKAMVSVSNWVPDLKENPEALQKIVKSPNFKSLEKLSDELKERVSKSFKEKSGSQPGTPGGQSTGAGDAATSGSRSLRWIIVFRTNSGEDYLRQLSGFKAKIVVPEPPTFKGSSLLFEDLTNPGKGKPLKGQELPEMEFTDSDASSAGKVARALGLDFEPPYFCAFFSKEMEEELAAKERSYRDRKEEDIYSTTFRVIERNGKFEVTVTDQKPQKSGR
jgi:hypothetical protein